MGLWLFSAGVAAAIGFVLSLAGGAGCRRRARGQAARTGRGCTQCFSTGLVGPARAHLGHHRPLHLANGTAPAPSNAAGDSRYRMPGGSSGAWAPNWGGGAVMDDIEPLLMPVELELPVTGDDNGGYAAGLSQRLAAARGGAPAVLAAEREAAAAATAEAAAALRAGAVRVIAVPAGGGGGSGAAGPSSSLMTAVPLKQ